MIKNITKLLVSIAIVAAALTLPAQATPTVTKIASCVAGTCNFSAPYHMTTSAGSAIGTMLMIVASGNQGNGGTGYTTACSDARSNSYTDGTTQQQLLSSPGSVVQFCWSVLTTAIQSGDTVTMNPTQDGGWNIAVYSITGAATSSPIDQIVAGNVTGIGSETWTTATLTPSQQPEIAIMIGTYNAGALTFSSYGNIIGSAATGLDNLGTTRPLVTSWRELLATTAGTAAFSGTGSTGDIVPMIFLTVKEAAGVSGATLLPGTTVLPNTTVF